MGETGKQASKFMEELRIDCRNQTAEELAKAKELRQQQRGHPNPATSDGGDYRRGVRPHGGCRFAS